VFRHQIPTAELTRVSAATAPRFAKQVLPDPGVTFEDRDHDQATLTITGGGRLDDIEPIAPPRRPNRAVAQRTHLPLDPPREQRSQFWILDPIALRSTLAGNVRPRGDGIVVIAELIGLDKKEFTPLLTNPSFRVNMLTFDSNATGR
jgi:hypothetical protein